MSTSNAVIQQFTAIQALLLVLLSAALAACGSAPAGREQRAVGSEWERVQPPAAPTPTTVAPTSVAAGAAPSRPSVAAAVSPPATRPLHRPGLKAELIWSVEGGSRPFTFPIALAVDRRGQVYVVDAANARLQKFDRDGHFLAMWGGHGGDAGRFHFRRDDRCADSYGDRCAPNLGGAVAVDEQDRVYVADWGNHRIQVFDGDGRFLTGWGREGGEPGEFRLPAGIAVDGERHVFVSDAGNQRVQQFDHAGRLLAHWPTRDPGALAADGQGQLWVMDAVTGLVRRFDRQGHLLTAWATEHPGDGVDRTTGLALDRSGQIYISGPAGRITLLDAAGQALAAWGGAHPAPGHPRRPGGIALDEAGDLYVADRDGHRLLKLRVLVPVTQ